MTTTGSEGGGIPPGTEYNETLSALKDRWYMYICTKSLRHSSMFRGGSRKGVRGSSHAHKCRDHAPYFAHARSAARGFAMRMLIDIVGVVVIERARVIGARRFSAAMCFGATERVYNAN